MSLRSQPGECEVVKSFLGMSFAFKFYSLIVLTNNNPLTQREEVPAKKANGIEHENTARQGEKDKVTMKTSPKTDRKKDATEEMKRDNRKIMKDEEGPKEKSKSRKEEEVRVHFCGTFNFNDLPLIFHATFYY